MARILSIEIDNHYIKILEGSKHGNSLTVHKSVFLDVETGSIDDGRISDVDLVVDTIQNAFREHKIKTKKAILITNTNSIITRILELPLLKKKSETMSMIKNELEHVISVDLNQYTLIYKKIDTIHTEEGNKGKYIVYGLPLSMYDQYMEIAEELKLEIIALDLSFNSLDKFAEKKITINKNIFNRNVATAFIDFGYDNIGFSVLSDGMNGFFRILSSGMKEMIRNYSTVYSLSHEDALKEVYKLSLSENFYNVNDISKLNIAEDVVNGWIDEFNRFIRYYNSNNKDNQINKIYLYGTYVNIKGLDEYLSSHLNIDVETINKISGINVNTNHETANFDIKGFLNSLLSLYVDKKDINFLYDVKRKHKTKFKAGIAVMALALIAVLTLGYYGYSYLTQKIALEKDIAVLEQFIENKENQKVNLEVNNLIKKISLLENYKGQVNVIKEAITKEDVVTSMIFKEINKSLPSGSKINLMAIDKSIIQMQCSSNLKTEVAQFERNLKSLEFIDHVYIPTVTKNAEGENANYTYSVVCKIKDVVSDEAQ